MKYIIAGGRDFGDRDMLDAALFSLIDRDEDMIIAGGAKGADSMAIEYCTHLARDIPHKVIKADWDKHGKAAGPIRNQQMAQEADGLIAFWDGKSRGTKDMIQKAFAANLEVHVYRYKK